MMWLGRIWVARGLALWACMVGTADCGRATEPTTELPAGGLAFAGGGALVLERESIVIGSGRVQTSYIVRNSAPVAHATLVALALPDVDMLQLDGAAVENPAYDPKNPANFIGLAALVDGAPAEMMVEEHALALGLVDVTALLRATGLPLYPLAPDLQARLVTMPDIEKARLAARSVIRMADGQIEPRWVLKSTFFWQQEFGPGQVRTLSASYQPVAGSGAWTSDLAATLKQRFCVPDTAAAALSSRAAAGTPAAVKWVNFLAQAGASARGPAASYQLSVDTTAKEKAYSCRSGLTEAARSSLTETTSDHVPDEEILVLFVE
jgi:hypothetical protein